MRRFPRRRFVRAIPPFGGATLLGSFAASPKSHGRTEAGPPTSKAEGRRLSCCVTPPRNPVGGTQSACGDHCGQLTRFDELCARREIHAAYLREELKNTAGVVPQEHYAGSTRQNYYCFGLYDAEHFSGAPRVNVIEALSAEGIPVTGSRGFRAVFSRERLERYRRQNHLPQNDKLCHKPLPSSGDLDRPEERRGGRVGGVH
jgi:hypothetical protein